MQAERAIPQRKRAARTRMAACHFAGSDSGSPGELHALPADCAAGPEPAAAPVAEYKTTIVFSVGNVPGALYHSLRPFAERRIDLAKIEHRPLRGSPFEYLFYFDLIGRADSAPISDALAELRAQAKSVRVLGTYPRYKQ
jgi:prephenate dehydratase